MANPPREHRQKELERQRGHEARQAEFRAEYERTHGPPEGRWEGKAGTGPPENKAQAPEAEIKHLGGGWYELPDGSRVQGRDAALEALSG